MLSRSSAKDTDKVDHAPGPTDPACNTLQCRRVPALRTTPTP